MNDRVQRLFVLLAGFFITNALLAEFIGVKVFSLEASLGFKPVELTLMGAEGLGFSLTAGILLWPVVFVMTDIINTYYGQRGVRFLSYLTVVLILFAFGMLSWAREVPPAAFWEVDTTGYNRERAFDTVFGQGQWIIVGSMVAFLVGQLLDAFVFARIRRRTGERMLWLRATASTLVSQFVDSFVVLFIAFYIGSDWSLAQVIAVGVLNYTVKFGIALLAIPMLYVVHWGIDHYLGIETAQALVKKAATR